MLANIAKSDSLELKIIKHATDRRLYEFGDY
jgi:hypothetical protein